VDNSLVQVDIASAQRVKLASPKPTETRRQYHRSVSAGYHIRQLDQLTHGGKPLLRVILHSRTINTARIPGDPLVPHGLAEDLTEARISLGRRRLPPRSRQSQVPGPHQLGGQVGQALVTERGHSI
jgi:hypothetical protein